MGSSIYNSATFIGKGGNETFFQSWTLPSSKGILVLVHGLGEHSGFFYNLVNELNGKDLSIYSKDQRGFGKSGGKRGDADSFMDYIYDLKLFINYINEHNEDKPIMMLGHGMGGIVAMKYALEYPDDLAGLILSGTLFMPFKGFSSIKKNYINIMSKIFPGKTVSSEIKADDRSVDSDFIEFYENSPVVHDRISGRLYNELLKTGDECLNRASEILAPLLVFHGKNDIISDPIGSEIVYERSSSEKKNLYLFEGLCHNTMTESGNEGGRVLSIIVEWLETVLKKKTKKSGSPVKRKTASGKKAAIKKTSATKKKASSASKKSSSKSSKARQAKRKAKISGKK